MINHEVSNTNLLKKYIKYFFLYKICENMNIIYDNNLEIKTYECTTDEKTTNK